MKDNKELGALIFCVLLNYSITQVLFYLLTGLTKLQPHVLLTNLNRLICALHYYYRHSHDLWKRLFMSPTVEWGSTLMQQKVYSQYKLNFMSDSSTKYKALCQWDWKVIFMSLFIHNYKLKTYPGGLWIVLKCQHTLSRKQSCSLVLASRTSTWRKKMRHLYNVYNPQSKSQI